MFEGSKKKLKTPAFKFAPFDETLLNAHDIVQAIIKEATEQAWSKQFIGERLKPYISKMTQNEQMKLRQFFGHNQPVKPLHSCQTNQEPIPAELEKASVQHRPALVLDLDSCKENFSQNSASPRRSSPPRKVSSKNHKVQRFAAMGSNRSLYIPDGPTALDGKKLQPVQLDPQWEDPDPKMKQYISGMRMKKILKEYLKQAVAAGVKQQKLDQANQPKRNCEIFNSKPKHEVTIRSIFSQNARSRVDKKNYVTKRPPLRLFKDLDRIQIGTLDSNKIGERRSDEVILKGAEQEELRVMDSIAEPQSFFDQVTLKHGVRLSFGNNSRSGGRYQNQSMTMSMREYRTLRYSREFKSALSPEPVLSTIEPIAIDTTLKSEVNDFLVQQRPKTSKHIRINERFEPEAMLSMMSHYKTQNGLYKSMTPSDSMLCHPKKPRRNMSGTQTSASRAASRVNVIKSIKF